MKYLKTKLVIYEKVKEMQSSGPKQGLKRRHSFLEKL